MATKPTSINDRLKKHGLHAPVESDEFKAAWKQFKDRNGVAGIVNLSLLKIVTRQDFLDFRDVLMDLATACRSVCNDPTSTPVQKLNAVEMGVTVVKAYTTVMEAVMEDHRPKAKPEPEKKKEEPPAEVETPKDVIPPKPRFYQDVTPEQNGDKSGTS